MRVEKNVARITIARLLVTGPLEDETSMHKPRSYTVLVSRILTFLLLGVMGFWGWQQQTLLFSPGHLSEKSQPGVSFQGFRSHAEFEKECERCHQSLEIRQAFLCTECHTNISDQIDSQDAVHGKLDDVLQCEKCHPDHRGPDFDPAQAALEFFDHDITNFRLIRHQFNFDAAPLVCSSCHLAPEFAPKNQACEDCHAIYQIDFMPQHIFDFGKDCLACHDGADGMARFEHAQTNFPLEGLHSDAQCASCHISGQFRALPMVCDQCHTEPKTHAGLFPQPCEPCHSTKSWSPALLDGQPFAHISQTGFSLEGHTQDYAEQPLICTTCHEYGLEVLDLQTCITCHANYAVKFMNDHQDIFGANCLSCHDGLGRYRDFNHENIYQLNGKHAATSCSQCHLDHVFQGTPTTCSQCHAEPPIHANWFGLKCRNCHSEEVWTPAILVEHGFPLEHGKADPTDCSVCHISKYTDYICDQCHEHEENAIESNHIHVGISAEELQDCFQCHPAGEVEETARKN